jgi:hypothetical protein
MIAGSDKLAFNDERNRVSVVENQWTITDGDRSPAGANGLQTLGDTRLSMRIDSAGWVI